MTAVKMTPANVGPCLTATQVSRPAYLHIGDIFNGDRSGQMWTSKGRGVKNVTFEDVVYYEPISPQFNQEFKPRKR